MIDPDVPNSGTLRITPRELVATSVTKNVSPSACRGLAIVTAFFVTPSTTICAGFGSSPIGGRDVVEADGSGWLCKVELPKVNAATATPTVRAAIFTCLDMVFLPLLGCRIWSCIVPSPPVRSKLKGLESAPQRSRLPSGLGRIPSCHALATVHPGGDAGGVGWKTGRCGLLTLIPSYPFNGLLLRLEQASYLVALHRLGAVNDPRRDRGCLFIPFGTQEQP